MSLGELPGDRETKPGARLGTLRGLEELVEDKRQVGLGDPSTPVLDRDDDGAAVGTGCDDDVGAGRGVLDSIRVAADGALNAYLC